MTPDPVIETTQDQPTDVGARERRRNMLDIRVITWSLGLLLAVGATSAANAGVVGIVFRDAFDNQATGQDGALDPDAPPIGSAWTISENHATGVGVVSSPVNSAPTALELQRVTPSGGNFNTATAEFTGEIETEATFNFSINVADNRALVHLGNGTDVDFLRLTFQEDSGGEVDIHNGGAGTDPLIMDAAFNIGEWADIEVVADLEAFTYTVAVNGGTASSPQAFTAGGGSNQGSATTLRFGAGGGSFGDDRSLYYIDDLQVQSLPEPGTLGLLAATGAFALCRGRRSRRA